MITVHDESKLGFGVDMETRAISAHRYSTHCEGFLQFIESFGSQRRQILVRNYIETPKGLAEALNVNDSGFVIAYAVKLKI